MSRLSVPKSPGGIWKRKQNDLLDSISGFKFCTSCMTIKPIEQIKIYKGRNGVGVPRCNDCQARRKAAMEARKK